MRVIAIDPGNTQSAYCIIDAQTLIPFEFGIWENESLLAKLENMPAEDTELSAVEMLQSYGNLIGRDVLETAVWIGRFFEALRRRGATPELIYRIEEKTHICNDSRAGDPNIRRALIDRFCDHDFRTGHGTLKDPDFFYGFKKDIWAAYAVGLTFIETKLNVERKN